MVKEGLLIFSFLAKFVFVVIILAHFSTICLPPHKLKWIRKEAKDFPFISWLRIYPHFFLSLILSTFLTFSKWFFHSDHAEVDSLPHKKSHGFTKLFKFPCSSHFYLLNLDSLGLLTQLCRSQLHKNFIDLQKILQSFYHLHFSYILMAVLPCHHKLQLV